jgi:hypothetical protein
MVEAKCKGDFGGVAFTLVFPHASLTALLTPPQISHKRIVEYMETRVPLKSKGSNLRRVCGPKCEAEEAEETEKGRAEKSILGLSNTSDLTWLRSSREKEPLNIRADR